MLRGLLIAFLHRGVVFNDWNVLPFYFLIIPSEGQSVCVSPTHLLCCHLLGVTGCAGHTCKSDIHSFRAKVFAVLQPDGLDLCALTIL